MRIRTLLGCAALVAGLVAPVAASPAAAEEVIAINGGFDACTAPSTSTMQAWLNSPYRTIGVYIGGVNRACSQPNLTASWVSTVSAQGWKILPIYVGLQAACTNFSARIDPNNAFNQGVSAANDAIANADALGMRWMTPIYFDMEGYGSSCATSTNQFLSGWTTQLKKRGRVSGVYGSASSTAANLANVYNDFNYRPPDSIWFAEWDGQNDTNSDYFLPTRWPHHQRVKQYRGGHGETWGGVTINIDTNNVDGRAFSFNDTTVRAMTSTPSGNGYWLVRGNGGVYAYGDAVFVGSRASEQDFPMTGITETASGTGYWLVAADGGVFAYNAGFHGSRAGNNDQGMRGIARSANSTGYWLVASDGGVFAYGTAPFLGNALNLSSYPIVGIAATRTGNGFWLVSERGEVYAFGDAVHHGGTPLGVRNIVGITRSPGGAGYYLFGADGGVFAYGDATFFGSRAGQCCPPFTGGSASRSTMTNGYWVLGWDGGVYAYGLAPYRGGSPA